MPPSWPPIPSAQVLQVFLLRMAFHSFHQPTRLAMRRVYCTAFQPPPDFSAFISGKLSSCPAYVPGGLLSIGRVDRCAEPCSPSFDLLPSRAPFSPLPAAGEGVRGRASRMRPLAHASGSYFSFPIPHSPHACSPIACFCSASLPL